MIDSSHMIAMLKTLCYTSFIFLVLINPVLGREYNAATLKEVILIESKLQPGDVLILLNGNWKDAELSFTASGTADKHIIIRAEEAGKVILTGKSSLRLGGNYIDVSGLYFTNGYSDDDVIVFRKDSWVANNCRVSNCAIVNYNPPNRMKENNWIAFFGRNNRFDHNYISDKKNLGATLVVELNDEKNQQNFHRIDSNYFGHRETMGGNGGETMRIGNSTYSRTSSNTIIENNFFDRCNGEVEIISVKSCDNIIRGNTFWECEGNVVLRHGNRNLVEGNRFIGNDKPLTGGVRVINAGHKILGNYFYKLKGERFRSSLAIMNGVPNSPINRYDPVRDVVISGNTFIDCDNIELCAGKDFERTAKPENVLISGNTFYNSKPVSVLKVFDDISGITFKENYSNRPQLNTKIITSIRLTSDNYPVVKGLPKATALKGFSSAEIIGARNYTGANWLHKKELYKNEDPVGVRINVMPGSNTLYEAVLTAKPYDTILVNSRSPYYVSKTIDILFPLYFMGTQGASVEFDGEKGGVSFFSIENGGSLYLSGINFNGQSKNGIAESFIRTSKQPTIEHYNLFVDNCSFSNLTDGRKSAFRAYAGTFADSIVFSNSLFTDITGEVISLAAEKEDRGYYNAENIVFNNCVFNKILMGAIDIYRGGNDESSAGPFVTIDHCTFNNVGNTELGYTVRLHGVQYSKTTNTLFNNSGKSGRAIWYEDFGWTKNSISNSNLFGSGKIQSFYGNAVKGKLTNYKPLFTNEEALDFSLLPTSPLKNKGTDKKDIGAIFIGGKLKLNTSKHELTKR